MYLPPGKILETYAAVLVRFALNSGKGLKKNEVVYLSSQLPGLPLAKEIYKQILRAGGHPIVNIIDDDFKVLALQQGSEQQIAYFPNAYYRGITDSIDHLVRILAENDPFYLKSCDPRKVILFNQSVRPFRDWLDKKEDQGKFTWTLCLSGTEGMAREAGLSERQYWNQIERACFLREPDPVATWRSVFLGMKKIVSRLNAMPIEKVHVTAKETDLWITIGENRTWLGGGGRNIPSFEIFTSPDWRGTEGHIFFDLPLYRYGNIIKDIRLEFSGGKVVKATAGKNEQLLHALIRQNNADKVGEFSLTDIRFSRINRFMANTLYDENFGGKYGNTHIALGKAYHEACTCDARNMKKSDYRRLGYNESIEHTDIIATSNRRVEAHLRNGTKRLLYENGTFRV